MKIIFISDIHNGVRSTSSTHPGVIRQANDLAIPTLQATIPLLLSHQPDLIVHMGDVIKDTYEKTIDLTLYEQVTKIMGKLPVPVISIVGNHDISALSKEEISSVFSKFQIVPQFSGVRVFDSFQLVYLDLEMNKNKQGLLPDSSLTLLSQLDPTIPALICSHYSIVPWDAANNFYTRTDPTWMTYFNSTSALQILRDKNLLGYVSAHAHWGAFQIYNKVPSFTNPAFSENIAAPNQPNTNPGAFSVLSITNNRMIWKSFSKDYAFLNIEV